MVVTLYIKVMSTAVNIFEYIFSWENILYSEYIFIWENIKPESIIHQKNYELVDWEEF